MLSGVALENMFRKSNPLILNGRGHLFRLPQSSRFNLILLRCVYHHLQHSCISSTQASFFVKEQVSQLRRIVSLVALKSFFFSAKSFFQMLFTLFSDCQVFAACSPVSSTTVCLLFFYHQLSLFLHFQR